MKRHDSSDIAPGQVEAESVTATDCLPGEWQKWLDLRNLAETDLRDSELRWLSERLFQLSGGRARQFAVLAMAMANQGISFQTDMARVGREDLGKPTDAWRRGVDDCDAKARLFVGLLRAAGLQAELVPLWRADGAKGDKLWLSHLYARWRDPEGDWQPVELTLRRAQLGEKPMQVPTEKTGEWLRS